MERRRTLLLVEDEHVLRELVAEFLRGAGFHVIEAADGPAGLARFADSGPIDLALVDLNLPGCSGVEVCEGLRRMQPDQPIQVVSAVILSDHHEALDRLGIGDVLTKPYHPEALLVRIRQRLAAAMGPAYRGPHGPGWAGDARPKAPTAALVFQATID